MGSEDEDINLFEDHYSEYHRTGNVKGEKVISDLQNSEVKTVKISLTEREEK